MNDSFVKKPNPVKACKYTGPKGEYPQWFHDALNEGKISPLGLQVATIYTDRGPSLVYTGDWVLRAEDGRLWPTDDAYFTANYEAAPAIAEVIPKG